MLAENYASVEISGEIERPSRAELHCGRVGLVPTRGLVILATVYPGVNDSRLIFAVCSNPFSDLSIHLKRGLAGSGRGAYLSEMEKLCFPNSVQCKVPVRLLELLEHS